MITINIDYRDGAENSFSFASSDKNYHEKLDEIEKLASKIERIAIYRGSSSASAHPVVFSELPRELITKSTSAPLVVRRARRLQF